MLDRALKYRAAFGNPKVIGGINYKFHPTEAEWHRLKQICEFLEPFDEITNLISDEVIRSMIVPMRERFDKYWEDLSDVIAMNTVFDPRLKLTLRRETNQQTDENEGKKGVLATMIYVGYENNYNNYDFINFRKQTVVTSGKSSLKMYLDDPPIEMIEFESLDILKYWKDNSQRYGELASMACDLLSLPIITVASESSFSIGIRVLNKYRSRILPKNVQALICCRNWLKEEDEEFDEDEILPSFQSIVDDEA
ncbi:PREDICTED: zinc finger BED domain-containing protein DAYSLEEPER-like [Camelina sativa]|uniref:Zinc finger BED domain-containing protein DAYSLEEPER-like n=1 Tax=Camelina sativa TaxID=90675 RepID=A0ABM1QKW2_CAMSA|nr:PREDICTED: zinc finger BED domain-containing protein DAYSLEEPER-like [Camelina sativa]